MLDKWKVRFVNGSQLGYDFVFSLVFLVIENSISGNYFKRVESSNASTRSKKTDLFCKIKLHLLLNQLLPKPVEQIFSWQDISQQTSKKNISEKF